MLNTTGHLDCFLTEQLFGWTTPPELCLSSDPDAAKSQAPPLFQSRFDGWSLLQGARLSQLASRPHGWPCENDLSSTHTVPYRFPSTTRPRGLRGQRLPVVRATRLLYR